MALIKNLMVCILPYEPYVVGHVKEICSDDIIEEPFRNGLTQEPFSSDNVSLFLFFLKT